MECYSGEIKADLFDICYYPLVMVCDMIDVHYSDEAKVTKEVAKLLTTNNSKFEQELVDKLIEYGQEDIEFCKKLMILIIAGKSYLLTNYDVVNDIDAEAAKSMFDVLNNLNAQGVLNAVEQSEDFFYGIIDDFLDYITRPYIFQHYSKELAIKSGIVKNLVKINPTEIFDTGDYIPSEEFITSEKMIQIIFDSFSKASVYIIRDNYDEADNYEDQDSFFHHAFLEELRNSLDDENDLCNLIHYMYGNIYEGLVVFRENESVKEYLWLIEYLENTSITELINRFLNEHEFGNLIVEVFRKCNDLLEEDTLIDRRIEFKEKGNVLKLQRLNPLYGDEEYKYKLLEKEG